MSEVPPPDSGAAISPAAIAGDATAPVTPHVSDPAPIDAGSRAAPSPLPPETPVQMAAPSTVASAAGTASAEPNPARTSPDTPVAPAAPLTAPEPPPPPGHPVVFHGRTDEYFRIWIVNSLLTLLTVGVFFSWAKVRKRRYLRGSTELMGHRFDYRASPVRLLIGHVVVLALFLAYSLFGSVYPMVRFGALAVGLVFLPWIVVRSLTFNAHNTVYRGLRFRFNTSLSAAFQVYLLEPLLIPLTLGFYYPAWQRSKRAYAVNNHRYGDAYFHFAAANGPFYSTYLMAGGIVAGTAFFGALIAGMIITVMGSTAQPKLIQLIPFFILYAFGFYVSRHLIYARLFNHVWNHTRLDDHRFEAQLSTGKWLGLQLTNLGVILITAGLLYPWALIRSQKYAAASLRFIPGAQPVEAIGRVGSSSGNATGDMAAEFIGIDFGL